MIIRIKDIVANALIEVTNKTDLNYVTLTQVEDYGDGVIEELRNQGLNPRLISNRYEFEYFKWEFSKYFNFVDDSDETLCFVNENISSLDLKKEFRGSLPLNVLLAFMNKDVVSKTLIHDTNKKTKKLPQNTKY